MPTKSQQYGRQSESVAVRHLIRNGYRILLRNYRIKEGEIDIIAKDGDTLVFIEVKARRSDKFGSSKYAITFQKQKKISVAALHYLKTTNQSHVKARFDVVTIDSPNTDIKIIKNAFELSISN